MLGFEAGADLHLPPVPQVLWGKVEVDKREVTLDDMWAIDLSKMASYKLIEALSEAAVEWMAEEEEELEEGDPPDDWVDSDEDGVLGEEPDTDEDEEDDDDDDDEDDDDEAGPREGKGERGKVNKGKKKKKKKKAETESEEEEEEEDDGTIKFDKVLNALLLSPSTLSRCPLFQFGAILILTCRSPRSFQTMRSCASTPWVRCQSKSLPVSRPRILGATWRSTRRSAPLHCAQQRR